MAIPLLAIQGAIVGISAIGNLFSASSRAEEINRRITRAQELAAQGLIDQSQISARLRSIDRLFNQRLSSVLNTTAIRSRGFANTGTIGAAAAGQVEGARLEASERTVARAQDVNLGIRGQIANLEIGKQGTDVAGALIGGATAGVGLAVETGKALGREPIQEPIPDLTTGANQTGPVPIEQAGNFNPFLRSNAQRLGGKVPTQSPFGGQVNLEELGFLPNVTQGVFG